MTGFSNQVGRRILDGLRYDNQTLAPHRLAERFHHCEVSQQIVAGHIHLQCAQFFGQAGQHAQPLGQQAHRQAHAVGAADVIQVLVRFDLDKHLVLGAYFQRLEAIDHFCLVVMDAAAAKMHVDDRTDIRSVKPGDQCIEN